jgi:hypothetical protein
MLAFVQDGGSGETCVGYTWQEWTATYTDGSIQFFDSRDTQEATGIPLDVSATKEPCTLLIEFQHIALNIPSNQFIFLVRSRSDIL